MKKALLVIALFVLCACSHNKNSLTTLYGTFESPEPIIVELLKHPAMQRLKKVEQYGTSVYARPTERYSRYEHSVGVFALLRRFGAPLDEQVAGLLHDSSHTVFSHVGDYLFNEQKEQDSYQDNIHLWHLQQTGVAEVLNKHGLTLEQASPENESYSALENSLPNMCADRIEYNLQGGMRKGLINREEFNTLLNDLRFEDGVWYFVSESSAQKFASISLYMTQYHWGAAWNILIYQWTADLIRAALDKDLVSLEEIHFSTDDIIWNRLINSIDPEIRTRLDKIMNYDSYLIVTDKESDTILNGKFRGIDPLVKTSEGYQRLTKLNKKFSTEFYRVKDFMEKGWHVSLSGSITEDTNDVVRENTIRNAPEVAINP